MLREHLGSGPEGEANIRRRLSRVPLGKFLTPEDLAQASLYLVSDDSVGVSGITHIVDGGLLAAAEYDVRYDTVELAQDSVFFAAVY